MPSVLACREKKYQAFQIGWMTTRTASRTCWSFSAIVSSPPRTTGDDTRNQRSASEPIRRKMSSGSV